MRRQSLQDVRGVGGEPRLREPDRKPRRETNTKAHARTRLDQRCGLRRQGLGSTSAAVYVRQDDARPALRPTYATNRVDRRQGLRTPGRWTTSAAAYVRQD